ncbi:MULTISPECIES: GNAT family N-acetyltransferase [unclassified Tolypothrix]|uniref:GNAT family N-acetyltransferase n=1 Tax=unclassified Tolypothrix TaxID=2649714 RepID=UPI0005EAC650|nr:MULTISPECIES: GNAT family N-acetyltransferase [unclassified Tolypothrix]BAY93623.1 GCN5-related N-acetyltransferase [Microchaete diplosiphon NIES-3275]EKE99582.1 acetyltransferase, GNAT family [Tolypothrix sp. PCC 7601]MBE9081678.1 GNAT family N-acetyltransferase [Tolypothrix sp. LEGE 11397]UYD27446.1 GNAT family N-acetyltransferase [Tolypothrix sp. PCC 7712]UYD36689.1 GNAT family N-acetyltransferase [Tolypothrix sp. PCC 7601]
MIDIALAQSDAEIERCFAIMQALRPHLIASDFVTRIRRQQQQGYRLAYLEDEGTVRAVAGFRISESLSWGKFLYVDDLVTQEGDRSQGYGSHLLNWLLDYAKSHACEQLHLDSGVQRFAAHRFYFQQRLEIRAFHFAINLTQ